MDTLKYCNRCFMKNKNNMKNKKIVVIGLSGESVFLNIDHLNENGWLLFEIGVNQGKDIEYLLNKYQIKYNK